MFAGEMCATTAHDVVIDWLKDARGLDLKRYRVEFDLYQKFREQSSNLAKGLTQRRMDFLDWSSGHDEHNDSEIQNLDKPISDVYDPVALQHLFERDEALKEFGFSRFESVSYDEFIGLEAQAIIAVLPMGPSEADVPGETPGWEHWAFTTQIYAMATRARALLAVIGDPQSIDMLNACLNFWGPRDTD
jgi:hypothetical protein